LASFFLTAFLFLPAAKVAELSMPKLSVSISRVSVEGSKLVILSVNFFLNFLGASIVKVSELLFSSMAISVSSLIGVSSVTVSSSGIGFSVT
jgi:hypothetical protein